MKRLFGRVTTIALAVTLSFAVGCSGSSESTTVADQDELAKWAAENPSPPASDIDPELAEPE